MGNWVITNGWCIAKSGCNGNVAFVSAETVNPVFSDHIKQYIFWDFLTGGCLLLHESSAESACISFLHYFQSAISNHLSIVISLSHEWMVA